MRYVDVNSAVCRLLGYTREELLQMGPQDLVPVSEAALGVSHDALIANPGAHSGIRTDYRCKDGARLPFELTRRALRSGESHIIVVIARDIRERLAAEEALRQTNEALQRFRVAMDNSADMIVLVDRAAMRFVDVNSTVCNRLGYTREELLEIGPQDLLPASREELERAYDELLADPTVHSGMKSSYRCKDGTLLPFESTRRVVRSGDRWLIVSVSRDVSERIAAEEALRKSDERFNLAVRATNDTVWDWDLETDELWWNENLERVFGHPLAGLDPSAASWYELIHPEDQARVVTGIHRLIDSGGESWNGDYRFRRSDGSYASVHDRGHVIHNPSGRAVRMIGAIADVSVRKAAEETVRNQARQQRLIAEFGQQALASADLGEVLTHAVQLVSVALQVDRCSALELLPDQHTLIYKAATGWPSEWTGQRQVPLVEGRQAHYVMSRREPVVVADYASETRFELPPVFREGVRSGALIPIPGAKGMYGILCVNTVMPRDFGPDDVSFLQSVANILAVAIERKNAEDRLAHLAQFDIITGLPNRHLLRDRLAQTLSLARRNQWLIGVLFIDLDRFKAVNDTFGHSTGDKLLGQVAGRLKDCVRSADTVGRLSGDEFAVVLSNLTKADDAGIVAQKIVNALASPFTLDGHQTYISASIGIAIYPGDALEADGLLKNADTAMYRAKEQGRNSYQFFLPQMNERLMERLSREAHLRGALERGEFLLHYQPKVSLETGRISGFEALLRWNHGDELISPADFIPILEDTGLIVPVGEWVLRAVCEQLKSWQSQGISPRPVSVNLSARQFQHKGLLPMVKQALHDWDVPARLLEFELTESLLMSDAEEAVQMLHQLKALGVRLSVDDFGTGYSSLSYLKRFPLDLLKIDRAFIRDAISDSDDATIIRTIISLAHSLGLQVVAEGVENEAQLRFLRAHGCDEMQGFYFARPMPPDACTRTLAEDRRLQAPAGMPDMECPSVLLVDDNEDDIFLLQRALLGEGYRITTAASPQAGFAALAQQRADIIISDHRMPGMSGVQFLNVVKKMYPDSVRIIATDTSDVGMLIDVVNNAAIHRFLSKGWDDERLRAEVRDAYQRRR
jgi:diguanylate cyclase (GGDEF)-like protein/PAS domain S-box-containing protein